MSAHRFMVGCRMAGYMAYVRDLMREAADAEDRWSDEDIAKVTGSPDLSASPRGLPGYATNNERVNDE